MTAKETLELYKGIEYKCQSNSLLKEIKVTFVHPTTGETLTASIDPNVTADEIYKALVAEVFIGFLDEDAITMGYRFAFFIVDKLRENSDYFQNFIEPSYSFYNVTDPQTLASIGVEDGDIVHIVCSTP